MELPGWNSIPFTGMASNFFFWASIFALVLLGLAEVLSHRYGGQHDLLVAQQQQAAKDASDSEISRLHRETAALNADAEKSRAAIAEANARALEAQVALAEFKAPRRFSAQQAAQIAAVAEKFKGVAIDIFIAGDAPDLRDISTAFTAIVEKSGGWKPLVWNWSGVGPITGVTILTKTGASPESIQIATALRDAIGRQNALLEVWPNSWESFAGMLNGPQFNASRTEIRLVIGGKVVQ